LKIVGCSSSIAEKKSCVSSLLVDRALDVLAEGGFPDEACPDGDGGAFSATAELANDSSGGNGKVLLLENLTRRVFTSFRFGATLYSVFIHFILDSVLFEICIVQILL
jgi:hypothetical protein